MQDEIPPPPERPEQGAQSAASVFAVAASIFLLTLLVFVRTTRFDFINVDDPQYVTDNPHVRAGLSINGVGWAFTTLRAANWHPLTWLSHMADVSVFGLRPGGHHLTSVLIHAVNAALVFLVLWLFTQAKWKSAIAAALFAVHPLRMESVAWIAERKDVLCGLFFLLAIGTYGMYARTLSMRWYAGTLLAFVLGILCKPMIVTLPAVLLLLDYWPLRRSCRNSRLIVEKIPFFAISAVSAAITFVAQQRGGALDPSILSWMSRFENAIWSYARYIENNFWPGGLAAFYPYDALHWGKVALAAGALIAITIAAILLRRRERAILIGWLWFLGMMIPVIGLVQAGKQSMADRYTYLPQIGLIVAIVWGLGAVAETWRGFAGVLKLTAITAIAILASCTVYQLGYWKNSYELFNHAIAVTGPNAEAQMCVALYLSEQHDDAEAATYYARALRIDPGNVDAHLDLARIEAGRGDAADAESHVAQAVSLGLRSGKAENNLANVLAQLGRLNEAVEHHQKSIALDPESSQAHFNYGVTLAQLGRIREAAPELKRAIELRPDYANARYVYGVALWTLGDRGGAVEQFRTALDCHPSPALRDQIDARLRQRG